MTLAFRAAIPIRDFWTMTAHQVVAAFKACDQDRWRMAWRAAYFQKVRRFPRGEDAIFRGSTSSPPARKRQTITEQYAMARLVSRMMR